VSILSSHLGKLVDSIHSFFHGCSTFLPVFDANTDTYDALHDRSPFAVNCVCMVAARVRDGGGKNLCYLSLKLIANEVSTGKASETYKKVLEEVHEISRASLFTPVTRHEAVQAMSKHSCHDRRRVVDQN
jgi:hypothetical protein